MESKENQKRVFLNISAFLTSFESVDLEGTGQLDTYFNVVKEYSSGDNFQYFLAEAENILREYDANRAGINDAIKDNLMPDSAYQGLAKDIITLWYMGMWNNENVSPRTYTQGLIWQIANAHPPGAKQPGFGSWNKKPLSANQELV